MPKRVVSVRMDDDVYNRIAALAAERRWSVSQWIAVAAERVADGEEAQGKRKSGQR